jgi:hypothetical protein
MEDQNSKNQKQINETDIGFILQRMDSLEKFFPCFHNLIEKTPTSTTNLEEIPQKTTMKKEERD